MSGASAMVRDGVRQAMAWLHGWTGLLLGYVLFVICLAGTLSVFKPEIGRWMRPEVTVQADGKSAIVAATGWLSKHAPGSTGWYLTAPDGRANTVEASYDQGSDYLYRALDPVTGAPVARETLGGEFFYRLHFELEIPYPWGRLLASLAAMVMLVALVTGIIAHKRIFKDFFTFRPAKGQRSGLDGHNATGVLAMPFHLMITFTGLLTLASLNMPWPISAGYGDKVMEMYEALAPGSVTRPAAGKPASLAPIAPMLTAAERAFGGGQVGRVYVFNPGDAASIVTVYQSDADSIGYMRGQASFDGATGRLLKSWVERRPAMRTYQVAYGLHMARFAPMATRWLYVLGGAMLTLAISTGMVLWIAKRRERQPLSIGNRILERLNVGVIIGVPLGAVAYFIANRLLPIGMAGRPEAEVSVALWTAAAAVLAGLALRPAIGWPLMMGLLAFACALAAVLGPVWSTEPILLTGNLLFLVMAVALALIVRRQMRRRNAPTPARRRMREQPA